MDNEEMWRIAMTDEEYTKDWKLLIRENDREIDIETDDKIRKLEERVAILEENLLWLNKLKNDLSNWGKTILALNSDE